MSRQSATPPTAGAATVDQKQMDRRTHLSKQRRRIIQYSCTLSGSEQLSPQDQAVGEGGMQTLTGEQCMKRCGVYGLVVIDPSQPSASKNMLFLGGGSWSKTRHGGVVFSIL